MRKFSRQNEISTFIPNKWIIGRLSGPGLAIIWCIQLATPLRIFWVAQCTIRNRFFEHEKSSTYFFGQISIFFFKTRFKNLKKKNLKQDLKNISFVRLEGEKLEPLERKTSHQPCSRPISNCIKFHRNRQGQIAAIKTWKFSWCHLNTYRLKCVKVNPHMEVNQVDIH